LTSADNGHLKHISEISRLYHSEAQHITFHFKLYLYRTLLIDHETYHYKFSILSTSQNKRQRPWNNPG